MGFPHIIRNTETDLVSFVRNRAQILKPLVARYGAVLLQNDVPMSTTQFETCVAALCQEIIQDNGEHNRAALSTSIYTPVFYPPEEKIKWHNENSFNAVMPGRIFFHCVRASSSGGETPLVDTRKVLKQMPSRLRTQFAELGVIYERTYYPGFGQDWRKILQISSREEVDELCRRNDITSDWIGDVLRTRSKRPAIVRHPETGEACWIAQLTHWHPASLNSRQRQALLDTFGVNKLPRECRFGDGSAIDDSIIEELEYLYQRNEVATPWQTGQTLIVDNFLSAHARNPFCGERSLMIALGDPYPLRCESNGENPIPI